MSEDHGPGPEVAITVNAGEAAAIEAGDGGQVGEGAALEPVAEAAVEIAEIEASRDVALAVIHQEGEADYAAARNSEELAECRVTIARLEGELEALRSPAVVVVPLTPEPSPEPPASPPAPSASEEEGGPKESPVEPEAAEVVAEPPKPKRPRYRWT